MEWYRVRFATTRRIIIWLLIEIISMLIFPTLLEAAYGVVQGSTMSTLIIFLYSIALLYVIVLSEGVFWYIAVYDSTLKKEYLPLFKSGTEKIELDENTAKIYLLDGTQKCFTVKTNAQKRHLKDFTVGWMRVQYMPAIPLRTYCQSCVKPTNSPQGMHITDWAQSFQLFASKKQKEEVRCITVYAGK